MGKGIDDFFFFQAGDEHDDDGNRQEGSRHLREPPATGHDPPNHNREGNAEQGQDNFPAQGKFHYRIRIHIFHVKLHKFFALGIGVGGFGIGLDFFRIPIEVLNDARGTQYQTDGAETDAFGKGNAGGVGGDDDREWVNGGEYRTH